MHKFSHWKVALDSDSDRISEQVNEEAIVSEDEYQLKEQANPKTSSKQRFSKEETDNEFFHTGSYDSTTGATSKMQGVSQQDGSSIVY